MLSREHTVKTEVFGWARETEKRGEKKIFLMWIFSEKEKKKEEELE